MTVDIEPRRVPLLDAKLRIPRGRSGTVLRTALVNRLRAAADRAIVTVVAPAGYGKTTLLAQWVERDRRPCAWVTLGEEADDGETMRACLAAALDHLGGDFEPHRPALVVLDGVPELRERSAVRALAAFAASVPDGSTLALGARTEPELPLARLRSEGRLFEIGQDELGLARQEAHSLLRNAGANLTEGEAAELHRRTEGWPAGLYLAALSLEAGGDTSLFAGDDRFVADYLRAEHLSRLSAAEKRFLMRTSVLERMSAPLCNAVLDRTDAERRLASIERSNLFVVPLDRTRGWYRYRRLFRDFLRAELVRCEPELVPVLNSRASVWCEQNGLSDAAVEYAAAAGELDRVARLVSELAPAAYHRGQLVRIERWLPLLEGDAVLDRHPEVCVVASWTQAVRGRPADARRWADAAERATVPAGPTLELLRALRCHDGAAQMLTDAANAARELPAGSLWRPAALLALGVAHALTGEVDGGDAVLADAVEVAASVGATEAQVVALCERSLLAAAGGGHAEADALAAEARSASGERRVGTYMTSAIEPAVSARAALRAGDVESARAELARAERLRPLLTDAVPWLSVQTRYELVRAHVGLAETEAARSLLDEAIAIMRRRPGLGVLEEQGVELRRQVLALDEPDGRWAASLTAAELRLLPLLATHLSFREIGERLFVSRNTVKTQAISVYRKFGVSSRSEAISRAVDLGLVDPAAPAARRELLLPAG